MPQHFQALVRLDTSSPPGNEIRAVEYLKKVLDAEGIPNQLFADPAVSTPAAFQRDVVLELARAR